MKKSTLQYIACGYLGFSLSAFVNSSLNSWQYYAIIIPTIILFMISGDMKK